MLTKIKHIVSGFSRAAGVEISLGPDGKTNYHVVILKKEKNILSIEIMEAGLQSVDKVIDILRQDIPVAVTINGRGVLQKKLQNMDNGEEDVLLSKVLPNANPSDFYMEVSHNEPDLFVSVIRKELLERVVGDFREKKVSIIYASCGPFGLQSVMPLIPGLADQLSVPGFTLQIMDNQIRNLEADQEDMPLEYVIGEEKVPVQLMIAYSAAFQLFLGVSGNAGLNVPSIKKSKEEFESKNLFKMAGYAVLAVLVGVMLINYLLYNYYQSENSRLFVQTRVYDGLIKEIAQLENEVKEKEHFLTKAGWLNSPRTSYYSDQIASSVPLSVKLSALKVNPLNERIANREKKYHFQTDTIYVKGVCNSPTVLNPWMEKLESLTWVKKASTVNYSFDSKSNEGNFEIQITAAYGF